MTVMTLNGDTGHDCDTEMFGGFIESGQPSDPWYAGMSSDYIGDVDGSKFDYTLRGMRCHDDEDCYPDDPCCDDAVTKYSIYCAPNQVACDDYVFDNVNHCNTTCYGESTYVYLYQAYLNDEGSADDTLYADNTCLESSQPSNNHYYVTYSVYSATLTTEHNDQSCDRSNEAPNITAVNVFPVNATPGLDLICNGTYSDPEEFSEQNSSYQWWKNGVNQNINSKVLGRNNLTPGDSWSCNVTPSDGLLFGDPVASDNSVGIVSTVSNVTMWADGVNAWSYDGYFDGIESQVEFTSALQSALDSCTADAEGYCNISLDFFSSSAGTLNISELAIYYVVPTPGISVSGLQSIYDNLTEHIFEFQITNSGNVALDDVNWSLDMGDGTTINSTIDFNLSAGESMSVYVHYNYSSDGQHLVTANGEAEDVSDGATLEVGFMLDIHNLSVLYSNSTEQLVEFFIQNHDVENFTGVNFTVDTGDGQVTNSTSPITLTPGESVRAFYHYNYSVAGSYAFNVTATSGNYTDEESITIVIS